jgi:hemerythrin-like domain-containing protein
MSKVPLKRHPALQDLSRDHNEALIQAHLMRKSAAGEEGAWPLEKVTRSFIDFWNHHAAAHFREEEEVLLPIYARHVTPTEDTDVRRMLDDHAWFRDVIYQLRSRFAEGDDVGDLVGEIGRRLHDHARLEERRIFERMQDVFTKADLDDIAERSRAFREQWRPPGSIGPPQPDD